MSKRRTTLIAAATVLAVALVALTALSAFSSQAPAPATDETWQLSEDDWRERLSEEEFAVLRELDTERAFSGDLWDHHEHGTYTCAGCGAALFASEAKFDSGTGWPSYTQPVSEDAVGTREDNSLFATRTEVHCKRCGGHLGHVFGDGPEPTGLRYCINSVSLDFEPAAAAKERAP